MGCGGGFFAAELARRGANVSGIDYAAAGIKFANQRYPSLDLRVGSAYDLPSLFGAKCFDLVILLDVIEHMSDHDKLLDNIRHVLKPNGTLIISTDADDCIWEKKPWNWLLPAAGRFSADGRAARFISRVENSRPNRRIYQISHINSISNDDLRALLARKGFPVIAHRVYPMVGAPLRDFILRFMPETWRGEHQCIAAQNKSN